MSLFARCDSATARDVRKRRRSSSLFILLAFAALLGMASISGWHSASFHDDAPGQGASLAHGHAEAHQQDPSSEQGDSVHLAAHAIGHGIDLPVADATAQMPKPVEITFDVGEADPLVGLKAAAFLRPPRA